MDRPSPPTRAHLVVRSLGQTPRPGWRGEWLGCIGADSSTVRRALRKCFLCRLRSARRLRLRLRLGLLVLLEGEQQMSARGVR